MKHRLSLLFSALILTSFGSAQSGVLQSVKLGALSGGLQGAIENYDQFGASMVRLGDLDGDGVEDVAVGADYHDSTNIFEGEVFVLFLNPDGSVKTYTQIASGVGGFTTILDGRDHFGTSLACLGDLDADGTIELAVGAFRDDDGQADAGAVYILSLASDGSVQSEAKISALAGGFGGTLDAYGLFGSALAALGDLDGDGLVELAVGTPGDNDGAGSAGAVWILSLRNDFSVQSQSKISLTAGGFGGALLGGDSFGSGLAAIGDIDGDGIGDLAVGAIGDDGFDGTGFVNGSLWILMLNSDGSVRAQNEIDDGSMVLAGRIDVASQFGSAIARYEDSSSGALQLLVGAPGGGGSTFTGAIWILTLASDGTALAAREISGQVGGLAGVDTGDKLGSSLLNLGDVDQDGFPVIMTGAVGDFDGGSSSGAAWLFTLGPPGTQVVRNGSGINPLCFSGSGPSILGNLWTGTIDASVNANARLTIVAARSAPLDGVFLGAGELLVDIFSGGFVFDFFVTSSGVTDVVIVGIPSDFSIAGQTVSLQAAVFGGGTGVLCNAIDLVLGG